MKLIALKTIAKDAIAQFPKDKAAAKTQARKQANMVGYYHKDDQDKVARLVQKEFVSAQAKGD